MLKTIGGVLPGLMERLEDSRLRGRVPFVVFDLDDTLFQRRNRHLRLLREFEAHGGITVFMRAAVRILINHEKDGTKGSIGEAALAVGADEAELRKAMHDFWSKRFHKDEYILEDAAVPGAADYLRALLCLRGVVVYITHRPESMRAGTIAALERNELPVPDEMPWKDRVRLVMKPSHAGGDLMAKIEAMAELANTGEVLACFENDPAYLDGMMEHFPHMLPVLLHMHHDSRHAGKHPAIVRIEDFLPR